MDHLIWKTSFNITWCMHIAISKCNSHRVAATMHKHVQTNLSMAMGWAMFVWKIHAHCARPCHGCPMHINLTIGSNGTHAYYPYQSTGVVHIGRLINLTHEWPWITRNLFESMGGHVCMYVCMHVLLLPTSAFRKYRFCSYDIYRLYIMGVGKFSCLQERHK